MNGGNAAVEPDYAKQLSGGARAVARRGRWPRLLISAQKQSSGRRSYRSGAQPLSAKRQQSPFQRDDCNDRAPTASAKPPGCRIARPLQQSAWVGSRASFDRSGSALLWRKQQPGVSAGARSKPASGNRRRAGITPDGMPLDALGNIGYIQRLWDAFESGGVAKMADLVPPDVTWRPLEAAGRPLHGTENLVAFWSSREVEMPTRRMFHREGDDVLVEAEYRRDDGSVTTVWVASLWCCKFAAV